ncbi:hypothetical protein F5888DRAFT_1638674 [Russula emetica]|nr:hypothetical protein F5888DRAFT_1638674 [Russula emetica]
MGPPSRCYAGSHGSHPKSEIGTVIQHHKDTHERRCFNCDFQWSHHNEYSIHLTKHHPDVKSDPDLALGSMFYIRKLCMYCDVKWYHSYQYKDHLKEHHPNVGPDAVLGEAPGFQRRDKIIARYYAAPAYRTHVIPQNGPTERRYTVRK